MKTIYKFVCATILLVALNGCQSASTHVLIGKQRTLTNPADVKLYLHPPAKYEEIGLVSANSRYVFFGRSDQHKMDVAIGHLKNEAAKLGANGILLGSAGDQTVGSVGNSFGGATAYGAGNGATGYGASTTVAAPIIIK